jgi:hypothetical protein
MGRSGAVFASEVRTLHLLSVVRTARFNRIPSVREVMVPLPASWSSGKGALPHPATAGLPLGSHWLSGLCVAINKQDMAECADVAWTVRIREIDVHRACSDNSQLFLRR